MGLKRFFLGGEDEEEEDIKEEEGRIIDEIDEHFNKIEAEIDTKFRDIEAQLRNIDKPVEKAPDTWYNKKTPKDLPLLSIPIEEDSENSPNLERDSTIIVDKTAENSKKVYSSNCESIMGTVDDKSIYSDLQYHNFKKPLNTTIMQIVKSMDEAIENDEALVFVGLYKTLRENIYNFLDNFISATAWNTKDTEEKNSMIQELETKLRAYDRIYEDKKRAIKAKSEDGSEEEVTEEKIEEEIVEKEISLENLLEDIKSRLGEEKFLTWHNMLKAMQKVWKKNGRYGDGRTINFALKGFEFTGATEDEQKTFKELFKEYCSQKYNKSK